MSENRVKNEYTTLFAQVELVREKLRMEFKAKNLTVSRFLELSAEKPPLLTASDLSKEAKVVENRSVDIEKLREEVDKECLLVQRIRQTLHDYRLSENFRVLLRDCSTSPLGLQGLYSRAIQDWRKLIRSMIRISFFDIDLIREFVVLESLFQVLHFYLRTPTESQYRSVKSRVCSIVSKWEAEDLLATDLLAQDLLQSFVKRKILRSEKDLFSQDDIDTHHSSNRKHKLPAPQLGAKRSLKEICFDLDEPICQKPKKMIVAANACHNAEPRPQYIDLEPSSKPNPQVAQSAISWTPGASLSQIQQSRKKVLNLLESVLKHHFKSSLAKAYSEKLEAQLFSLHYGHLNIYTLEAHEVSKKLESLAPEEVHQLLAVSFDYGQIMKLGDITQHPVSQLTPDIYFDPMTAFPQNHEPEESFDDLERLTRVKEEEIAHLRQLLTNVLQENDLLKNTLTSLKHDILELNSNS